MSRAGDEINLIQAERNYGWPVITCGINYDGTIITEERSRPGMEQPLVYGSIHRSIRNDGLYR